MHQRLADVDEEPALNLGEIDIAEGSTQGQMSQQWKSQLLIEHVRPGSDDVPELRIAAEPQGASDVDPPGPVSAAVKTIGAEGLGAARAESEIPPPIATQDVAVEATVGEVAGDSGSEAEAPPING